ncbi:chitin disaccharide deacetylase [Clostridium sp.]|uniref:chitin disaccharide deacetylase n=1 Tax=Clostridium sp. TaxID=1506 RepID=UPI002607B595|nr:chitin disaccharide deacetylase [Clostridium sp.]
MKLIVNADDFGYSNGVNYGIIDSYKNGIVRSTTIMAGMPGFNHAVELAKENKGLGVGVHLTLTCYKPVLENHKTIVNENGYFDRSLYTEESIGKIDLEEIYREFEAQIEKVKKAGIEITHLDSHHHVHTIKEIKPVIEKLLDKYKLPIRGGLNYKIDYDKVVDFKGTFYNENANINGFENLLKGDIEVFDVMSHPAYLDKLVFELSSYNTKRMDELELLTSKEVKDLINEGDIELVNYRDVFK